MVSRHGRTRREPDWQIEDGYCIEVQGRPTVRTRLQFLPPPDFQGETLADFMVLGHIMTAMPAINAIPGAVAAQPGIASYADLPLLLRRGLARLCASVGTVSAARPWRQNSQASSAVTRDWGFWTKRFMSQPYMTVC